METPHLYTFYTDSHKQFYDEHFLPTVPKNSFVPVVKKLNQDCPTGEFHSEGWMNTMRQKVYYIWNAVQWSLKNNHSWFVHCDVDVRFYADVFEDLQTRMIENPEIDLFAMDDIMYCAGFFAMRVNQNTFDVWSSIMTNLHRYTNDQIAMNWYIDNNHLMAQKLPRELYFNYCHLGTNPNEHYVWTGDEDKLRQELSGYDLSKILVHHGNYTIGIQNKLRMMEIVREEREKQIS